jgi:hypothetical protein
MVKEKYYIEPINRYEAKEWVLKKHYAKSMPSLMHIFGLFDRDKVLNGVCGYGMPANFNNNNIGEYKVLELVRLVINEGHEKNVLSYFVTQTFKFLPKPIVLISYSDINAHHHGYIYQATNWIYTGDSGNYFLFVDRAGKETHKKTLFDRYGTNAMDVLEQYGYTKKTILGKHRYFYFLGNKLDKKKMKKALLERYSIKPYPKGDNVRYNANYEPDIHERLF